MIKTKKWFLGEKAAAGRGSPALGPPPLFFQKPPPPPPLPFEPGSSDVGGGQEMEQTPPPLPFGRECCSFSYKGGLLNNCR